MNQTGQIVFIAFIIFYLLFWGAIIILGIPREERHKQQRKFDERQQVEQGRACKYAYLTLICYLILYAILTGTMGIVWCETAFGLFLGIAFSISVFLAYCVFQDAYFSIGENAPGALIGINIIGLSQLVIAIEHITEGTVLQNGIVTGDAVHLLFFAVILLLDVFVLLRKRMDTAA